MDQIPADEEGTWLALHADLGSLEYSICYAAPEIHDRYWVQIAEILSQHLPNPSSPDAPEFCKTIADIFSGKLTLPDV